VNKPEIAIFWFRRDLRLTDNVALYYALKSAYPVVPLFIFDEEIIAELDEDDARIQFIYNLLSEINKKLKKENSSLKIEKGNPIEIWEKLIDNYTVKEIYFNNDYEPYAIARDAKVAKLCKAHAIKVNSFKDQVIFEPHEILKANGTPYKVYTPYKNKWIANLKKTNYKSFLSEKLTANFSKQTFNFPTLKSLGFKNNTINVKPINYKCIENYAKTRNIPAIETSNISPHLRFGTVSIRKLVKLAISKSETYLNELIWREFFMQILFHYPTVVYANFKSKYNAIKWRNNEEDFKKWCNGKTGYALVDAGINQLNQTGYMHNRVRMVVASFLCKHLLIDWRWGEAYFAKKLLDYELASNNGNWQWVAGTGCDAAPYFRVFNPITQLKKFDPNLEYVTKWNPNFSDIQKIIPHQKARDRYLNEMRKSLA